MGLTQSLLTLKVNLKSVSAEALKLHYRCLKEEEDLRILVKGCIENNDNDARKFASEAIVKRNQSLRFLQFKSTLDILAAQVEIAIKSQKVNDDLKRALPHLNEHMKNKKLDSIQALNEFERIFDHLGLKKSFGVNGSDAGLTSLDREREIDLLIAHIRNEYIVEDAEKRGNEEEVTKVLSELRNNMKLPEGLEEKLKELARANRLNPNGFTMDHPKA